MVCFVSRARLVPVALSLSLASLLLGGCTNDEPIPINNSIVGETYTVVMSRMELITSPDEDGLVIGLNLDDVVSDLGSEEGCFKEDFTSPYGVEGVDNQLATLGTIVTTVLQYQGDFSELVQGSINDGRFILLLQLDGVDDPVNDDDVTVRAFWGDGPLDVGNDGRPVPGQSFDVDMERSFSEVHHQRIVDGHLEGGPIDVVLPVNILLLNYDLPVHEARFSLDINPDDGTITGVLGGGVPTEDVLGLADATMQSSDAANALFGRLADLNPFGEGCTHMSAAFEITAVTAFVLDPETAP